MQLNTVVLPAPFGPIRAVMVPRATSKDRSSTATSPPKRMVRCSTRRSVSAGAVLAMAFLHEVAGNSLALLEHDRGVARRNQPARPPDHDQHHGEAEQQHAVLGRVEGGAENPFQEIELAHDLGAADHGDGGDGDADLLPMPPSTTIDRIVADSRKVKDSGEMKPCRAAKNEPAKPANIAPMAKAVSLVLVVLMPSERQATSSSRSASQARPTGSRRSRTVTKAVSRASARMM